MLIWVLRDYLTNKVRNLEYTNLRIPRYFSDYYIENGSFMKLDNVLGYNFTNLGVEKLNMRIYATAQNLMTVTKYSGLDPEVFSGIDNNIYPRPETSSWDQFNLLIITQKWL